MAVINIDIIMFSIIAIVNSIALHRLIERMLLTIISDVISSALNADKMIHLLFGND